MTATPVTSGAFRCLAAVLVVSGLVQSGCGNAGRQANSRLRTQVHELEQNLDQAKLQIAELESQLASASASSDRTTV
ncbi:MAG: hypothetical protein P8L37_06045, partial [Phycisphaerales bacterium]|nr:hypothetical protein [Phycisphaerales bacterium]